MQRNPYLDLYQRERGLRLHTSNWLCTTFCVLSFNTFVHFFVYCIYSATRPLYSNKRVSA